MKISKESAFLPRTISKLSKVDQNFITASQQAIHRRIGCSKNAPKLILNASTLNK